MKRGGKEVEYETFLAKLSKPARNALLHAEILSFEQIATLTEKEFLAFHGIGPKSLPVVQEALEQVGLIFKK